MSIFMANLHGKPSWQDINISNRNITTPTVGNSVIEESAVKSVACFLNGVFPNLKAIVSWPHLDRARQAFEEADMPAPMSRYSDIGLDGVKCGI
jgi:hypothetical protein